MNEHTHFKAECRKCGAVIRQCRCWDGRRWEKSHTFETCATCLAEPEVTADFGAVAPKEVLDVTKYPKEILEGWATFEALRKLGFPSDYIFWKFQNTLNALDGPGIALNIVLEAQGLTLSITCSRRLTVARAKKLEELSREFVEHLNAGRFDSADLLKVFHGSWIWGHKLDFLYVLNAKGFALPTDAIEHLS